MIVVQGPNMSGRLSEFEFFPLSLTANPNALKITFSVDRLDVLAIFSELVPVKSFIDSSDSINNKNLNHSDQSEQNVSDNKLYRNNSPVAYERSLKVYLVDSGQDYLISPARCVFVNNYQFSANEELVSMQNVLVDPDFWKNPIYDVPDSIAMAIRDIILSVLVLAEISLNAMLAELHEINVAEDYDLWEDDVDIYDLLDQMGLEEDSTIETEDDLAEMISWFWFMDAQEDDDAHFHQDGFNDSSDPDLGVDDKQSYLDDPEDYNEF